MKQSLFVFLLYLAWIPAGSLLAASQSNPIESLSFGFLSASQKKPNLAQELCVTVTCPYLNSTCSFLHGKANFLFFLNKQ